MQTVVIAGFVQNLDRAARLSLMRHVMRRFRAMRLGAEMALIEPRLREDAGLLPGGGPTGWPQPPFR